MIRTRYDVTAHEVVKLEVLTAHRALVSVEISTVLPKFGGPHRVTTQEVWLLVVGQWYRKYEPVKLFPEKPPR